MNPHSHCPTTTFRRGNVMHFALILFACSTLAAADLSLSAPSQASPGQSVTVQVQLANQPGAISATQLRLDFDKTRLAYVSATKDASAAILTTSGTLATINADGSLRALQEYANVASSGTLLTVTFTALAVGTATVTLVPSTQPGGCRIFDSALDPVTVILPSSATSISINAPPAGSLAFSAASFTQVEGTSGTSAATITVTRTGGSAGAVGVSYATANGTATAGSDYTASSGILTWADGDAASKTFTVTVIGDTTVEPNETVLLALSSPTGGASLGQSSATLTITNDDVAPAGTLAFSAASFTQVEGNTGTSVVAVTVTRTGGSAGAVSVSYATANGTATAGSDYTAASGTLTWTDGDAASKTITVTIQGDTNVEPDETVQISLSAPTGGAALGLSSATVTITNDDSGSGPGGLPTGPNGAGSGGSGSGGGCGAGTALGTLLLLLFAQLSGTKFGRGSSLSKD